MLVDVPGIGIHVEIDAASSTHRKVYSAAGADTFVHCIDVVTCQCTCASSVRHVRTATACFSQMIFYREERCAVYSQYLNRLAIAPSDWQLGPRRHLFVCVPLMHMEQTILDDSKVQVVSDPKTIEVVHS